MARDFGARAGTPAGAARDADAVRAARIVSAFNTVPSEVLSSVFEDAGNAAQRDLVYCGDDAGAKELTDEEADHGMWQ